MPPAEIHPLPTRRPIVLSTRRDYVYARLLEGPVSHRELAKAGVPMVQAHIDSLEGEGHRIERIQAYDDGGLPTAYFELIHDAWDEAGMAA